MASDRLRIIHCFRSPVGGIFRHVRDLIDAQVAAGHAVGILCDSITGGIYEERLIEAVRPKAALGVHRVTMRRSIAPSDLLDLWRTYALLRDLKPDVLHGHGAKGGAYVRLVGTVLRRPSRPIARLYTPHGGSMHYDPRRLRGRLFFLLEAFLARRTDHLLFVSEYEQAAFQSKVGPPNVPYRIVYNGLSAAEFEPVAAAPDAADFLYIGMLRALKGPDIFLEALARMGPVGGRDATAVVVGAGELAPELRRFAETHLPGRVTFHEPMPAREAFRLARVMVLPSRADSLPYVTLEALAAGLPVVAADVGGVGEIIPRHIQPLVPPRDADALAAALAERLRRPAKNPEALVRHIRQRFAVETMAAETMAAYQRALAGPGPNRAAERAAPAVLAAGGADPSITLPTRPRAGHPENP